MAQTHVLRMIADRIELGWPKPSGVRLQPGTVVVSFENQDGIEDWLTAFGCSKVEDNSFTTLKAKYSIKSFVGSWFFERILVVQCAKAKIGATPKLRETDEEFWIDKPLSRHRF